MQDRPQVQGFTLVEILVAVAVVAILAALLSPLVVKHLETSRVSRARSDAAVLVSAIETFHLDTGRWPVSSDGVLVGSEEISRLVGLPASALDPAAIPGGAGSAPGDSGWSGDGDGGEAAALADLLIFNRSDSVNPLYPLPSGPGAPGWRGPYVDRVPLDPWGRPYVCNVRYLLGANVDGVSHAEAQDHAVLCLSAGANGLFETAFEDGAALAPIGGGDDAGAVLQGRVGPGLTGGGGAGGAACGILGPEPFVVLWLAGRWRRRRRRASSASG